MNKRQLLINAIMSSVQFFVIGLVLFILYKFLLNAIGVEQLGIWSLVLATASVTQIANFGLSGSVVKFVAKYIAHEDNEKVSGVIQTATISIAVFVGIILLIGYPVAKWLLGLVISDKSLPLALSILPYAFFAIWLMVITGIFQSGLDGYQRIDIRSVLLMGGAIVHLILCVFLAPHYGLMGVAYARVIQNLTILVISWLLIRRCLPLLPIFPYRWNKELFKEIILYGVNFQMISVSTMFYDPITKALLSKFGGLSLVGYYEMANKLILLIRNFIVSANQVIVPVIAELMEKTPQKIHSVYSTSYRLLFYLAVPLFSLIIMFIPYISYLWIGHYEQIFVVFASLLAIGWFLNTINAPAHFAFLGIGELRWNVISAIIIGLLNVGLGILLGFLYDGLGVVIAWVISLSFGSSIIYLSYHRKYNISLMELLPKASRTIFFISIIGVITTFAIQNSFKTVLKIFPFTTIIPLIFAMLMLIFLYFHPMRRQIWEWIIKDLLYMELKAK